LETEEDEGVCDVERADEEAGPCDDPDELEIVRDGCFPRLRL
jgi:hypothetical protein